MPHQPTMLFAAGLLLGILTSSAGAEQRQAAGYPPRLPGGKTVATDQSPMFLQRAAWTVAGVPVAETPPTIDFMYYPGQDYLPVAEGQGGSAEWSCWGDNLAVEGKCYSAIGDHVFQAYLYEYDVASKKLRRLLDISHYLRQPAGHYAPGKVHGRLNQGRDGWLYFATHRGSEAYTTEAFHYRGDWLLRHHPQTGKTETLAFAPVGAESIPVTNFDEGRDILYGSTAQQRIGFAYDVRRRKLLFRSQPQEGAYRWIIVSKSTGRVYFDNDGVVRRYDPSTGEYQVVDIGLNFRSATEEVGGAIYTISADRIYRFQVQDETVTELGEAKVGNQGYVPSLDADPSGRFLYYTPVCHEPKRAQNEGVPIIQFDTQRRTKKVICYFVPFYRDTYGYIPVHSFGSSISPQGDKMFITWTGVRPDVVEGEGKACALAVVHIPESERR